jgi:hypothetical protein
VLVAGAGGLGERGEELTSCGGLLRQKSDLRLEVLDLLLGVESNGGAGQTDATAGTGTLCLVGLGHCQSHCGSRHLLGCCGYETAHCQPVSLLL